MVTLAIMVHLKYWYTWPYFFGGKILQQCYIWNEKSWTIQKQYHAIMFIYETKSYDIWRSFTLKLTMIHLDRLINIHWHYWEVLYYSLRFVHLFDCSWAVTPLKNIVFIFYAKAIISSDYVFVCLLKKISCEIVCYIIVWQKKIDCEIFLFYI